MYLPIVYSKLYSWVPKTHRLPTVIQCNCNTNRSGPICFIELDIHYILIIIELNHYNRPSTRINLMSANRTSSFATARFGDTEEVRFAENGQWH